jgi:phosphoglycolate phosphatase
MIKLIAFDFDGTLADSVDFCIAVFHKVFAKYLGDKAPTSEEIYQNFGMNEPGVIRFFMGKECPEAAEDYFILHKELHPTMCPTPFPGVIELLDYLKTQNVELTVLTGRDKVTCSISMDYLKLGSYFTNFQYGSPLKLDKCAQLINLCETRNLDPSEIVYVGDAVSDVVASHQANVRCFTAAWAKSARIEELNKINSEYVFLTVKDMIDQFKKEFSK